LVPGGEISNISAQRAKERRSYKILNWRASTTKTSSMPAAELGKREKGKGEEDLGGRAETEFGVQGKAEGTYNPEKIEGINQKHREQGDNFVTWKRGVLVGWDLWVVVLGCGFFLGVWTRCVFWEMKWEDMLLFIGGIRLCRSRGLLRARAPGGGKVGVRGSENSQTAGTVRNAMRCYSGVTAGGRMDAGSSEGRVPVSNGREGGGDWREVTDMGLGRGADRVGR